MSRFSNSLEIPDKFYISAILGQGENLMKGAIIFEYKGKEIAYQFDERHCRDLALTLLQLADDLRDQIMRD